MHAALLLLMLSSPARAGVAVSAEAGADAAVPRISLQTSLSPMSGPALGATAAPGLNASLAAPSGLTPQALPAPLPVSAVASPTALAPVATPAAVRPVLSAAATPDAPNEAPESAASPSDKTQPSFKTKILGMLKSMANPFGGKKAEEAPPASEAERLDREFAKLDLWGEVAPGAREEIEKARAGIRATMGDIAARYDMNADRNQKVYFFQSAQHGGFVPLDASNGEILFFPTRMGHALNLFDLDAPELQAARADGRIKNFGAISMDFHGMRGVPYSAYLAPPVEVFIGTAKKLGLKKLSRDEETLATIRYLEAVATRGGAYVPR
ncbi:MAG: hypothetical protein HYX59_08760 [Elusimicrobia bacterium]|nr:hypothetical protein [Elusimicrobiota bacterium]